MAKITLIPEGDVDGVAGDALGPLTALGSCHAINEIR